MSNSEQDLKVALDKTDLDSIERHIGQIKAQGALESVAALQSQIPYCREYEAGRPILVAALAIIEKIPFLGKKAAALIRLLMAIADTICAVPAAKSPAPAGG